MELNDDCELVAKDQLMSPNGNPVFKIGHEAKSCTEIPGFYVKDDIYFLDCPGLEDQDKTKEGQN